MGVHDGHRQRLRASYVNGGLSSLSDVNTLELLLFYPVPRKDTNVLAHRLLDTFGSIDNVFKADLSELMNVEGVTENIAVFIKLIPDIQNRIALTSAQKTKYISSSSDAGEYFKAAFKNLTEECVNVMCLDANNKLLKVAPLGKGSVNEVNVNVRTIVDCVVRNRASSIILAHNHPDGNKNPSAEDIDLTRGISSVLSALQVAVLDHIIVADDDYYSFADNSML